MFAEVEEVIETLQAVEKSVFSSPPSTIRRVESKVINQLLPQQGVLVDIGTGHGIIPQVFHSLGARVISIDFPAAGGTEALRRLIEIGIEGHYAEVGRVRLPIDDSSTDVVFVGNVIEHLPQSPREFLADLKRVLRPGGYIVIDTINAVDLRRRIKFLCGISNWPPIEYLYPMEAHHEHHKEYKLDELKAVLDLAGFERERAFAFEAFFTRPLRGSPLRYLRKSMRLMNDSERRSIFADRFQPANPAEYVRLAALGLVSLFPGLRSDILVVGRKPRDQ